MRSRILMSFEPLPERAPSERVAHIDADVRTAMEALRTRLKAQAVGLHVTGWVEEEDAEYAILGRTICGRLRITRDGG